MMPDFAALLAEHQRGGGHGFVVCESTTGRCGWQSGVLSLSRRRAGANVDDLHRAHVASILEAALVAWLRSAQTQAHVARAVAARNTRSWGDAEWGDLLPVARDEHMHDAAAALAGFIHP